MSDSAPDEEPVRRAVLLDYLAHGSGDGGRRQYDRSPVGYGIDLADFTLYELALDEDERVTIGSDVVVDPAAERDVVLDAWPVGYDGLSSGAQSELEYVIEDVVTDQEERFVDFYNEAQPITLRLHQLNLLPGIGEKLRDGILDQRKREPFESFEDLESRVSGLHDPAQTLVERILEELENEELKYKTFVGRRDE